MLLECFSCVSIVAFLLSGFSAVQLGHFFRRGCVAPQSLAGRPGRALEIPLPAIVGRVCLKRSELSHDLLCRGHLYGSRTMFASGLGAPALPVLFQSELTIVQLSFRTAVRLHSA